MHDTVELKGETLRLTELSCPPPMEQTLLPGAGGRSAGRPLVLREESKDLAHPGSVDLLVVPVQELESTRELPRGDILPPVQLVTHPSEASEQRREDPRVLEPKLAVHQFT